MKNLKIIIITGLSGSGKSTAINALEDEGYFCVDNMPVLLLPKFLELRNEGGSEVSKLALGMDIREADFVNKYPEVFNQLQEAGYSFDIIFLEASEEVLVKRFSQTRRQHPVAGGGSLTERIMFEKKQLSPIKKAAEKVIDTSNFSVHQLKEYVIQYANQGVMSEKLQIEVISFGFKYGIPLEADLLIDVRFVPNPYFVAELKPLTGTDQRVVEFVTKSPETIEFLRKYCSLLEYLLPLYEKEGKSNLTIAVGCTGGRHRSVTLAQKIFDHIKEQGRNVAINHRDLELS